MKKTLFLIVLLFLFLLFVSALFSQQSYFSVQTHFGHIFRPDMDTTQVGEMLDLIRDAGIRSIRDEVYWSLVETEPGVYDFPENFDFYITEVRKRDIEVLLILNYNNELYAPFSNSGISTDSNRSAFAEYCKKVADRYFPLGVRHYEIWNEPNIPIFWNPSPNSEDYFRLLQVVYPALKSIDPAIKVIGCATSPAEGEPPPFISGVDFIRQVFELGGKNFMDAVSFHQYHVDLPPENYLNAEITRLQEIVGEEMPIWLTEFGYPTNSGWPHISLEKQANYLPRFFLLGKSIPQLKRVFYYDLKNDGTDETNPEHNFGILNYNLQPKPAYFSLKAAAILIGDRQLYQKFVSDNYVFQFAENDSSVFACWRKSGRRNTEIPMPFDKIAIFNRDGNLQYYEHISGDSLQITLDESVTYIRPVNALPPFSEFKFTIPRVILFPEQIFSPRISCKDTADIDVRLSPSLIDWDYSGNIGNVEDDGKFVSSQPDSGYLIARYRGENDSLKIKIVERGDYLVDGFRDTENWGTELLNLDTNFCSFSTDDSLHSEGNSSGKIAYQFTFNSQIPRQNYLFKLKCFLPIPGESDSLLLDVYGDGASILLEYHFQDAEGKIFTKKLYSIPINWKDEWKTVPFSFSSLRGNAKYPLFLTKIVIYVAVTDLTDGETYRGKVYFDNLRSSLRKNTKVFDLERNSKKINYNLKIFPNPTNSKIKIQFSLQSREKVSIDLFNLLGQKMLSIYSDSQISGKSNILANLEGLTGGLYFLRCQLGSSRQVKKILLLK